MHILSSKVSEHRNTENFPTMLFTVSLAFVVPLISAVSLPVLLRPDSPDSNLALFQGRNTTSLTTSPVTPLNIAGRLNNTSSSILASTTNSSSLGLVNTHAYRAPPRYPPGYPDHPYNYHVRFSDIRLKCWRLRPDPLQNDTALDILFRRLQLRFGDPSDSSKRMWDAVNRENQFTEGEPEDCITVLGLQLPWADESPDHNMTYRDFHHVLIGMNNLRHDYPMLNMDSVIYREGEGESTEIGVVWLDTYEPDPDMTEELAVKAE